MNSKLRMQEFLVAATRATDGDGRVFRLDHICGSLEWEHADCQRVAALLEKEGLLNRLPDGEAILTTAGVQAAREA
jgi:hypothetical protein